MKVKLKVTTGKRAGKTIRFKQGTFLIGRGQDAFLRARSDTVSRRHCEIIVDDSSVAVEDLNSKNGTLVNGRRVEGRQALKAGDQLQVGPMRFEVLVESESTARSSEPAAADLAAVAAPTEARGEAGGEYEDDDISHWLDDDAEEPALDAPPTASKTAAADADETRQSASDRTSAVTPPVGGQQPTRTGQDADDQAKRAKQQPGKLPRVDEPPSKDSGEAAGNVLRQLSRRK